MLAERVIKTEADKLLELIRSKGKLSIDEASKLLNLRVENVQSLVDFFVEEKVIGIEYKFTTPYIYLYESKFKKNDSKIKSFEEGILPKKDFYKKAEKKNISLDTIDKLWLKYVETYLNYIKGDFYKKARIKGISFNSIDTLWNKYFELTFQMLK